MSFFAPKGFGPELLGFYPLGEWNFNVIADWRSGYWVTWNPSRKLNVAQNVRSKDWYNIQLRLQKLFKFNKFEFTFFVDLNNFLNTRRLSLNSFYDSHDYNYYFQSLHLPKSNDYDNIVGDDKVGDYRNPGVAYQPIEQVGNVSTMAETEINSRVIYYENSSRKYMNYSDGSWSEVSDKTIQKVLDDKAYIDMPNHSYFNFLNPRSIFFGIKASFSID